MGIETRIDAAGGLRTHVVTGSLSLAQLREALERVYKRPDFDPGHHVLWDLRGADLKGFAAADVEETASLVAARWKATPGTRAALVVTRDVDYVLSRMYEQMLTANWQGEIRVFRDGDEALRWLAESRPAG